LVEEMLCSDFMRMFMCSIDATFSVMPAMSWWHQLRHRARLSTTFTT